MNGRAYYNENNPFAAQWLRNLIAAGHISAGDVDDRSINDVRPEDVRGYTQCHFFGGVGGWSYALRLAGWPDDRPVWTGSCPCQPFSSAGRGGGFADHRHLWPDWFRLIAECRPATIFGEQVASPAGLAWFDLVHADLEGAGYAVGAADLCAAGIAAPHIRQRLWFVADAEGGGRIRDDRAILCPPSCCVQEMAEQGYGNASGHNRATGELGHAGHARLSSREFEELCRAGRIDEWRTAQQSGRSPWSDAEWLYCRDGKYRAAEPGSFPVAHGISGRVGRLRAYGNAIVPQIAAKFIEAADI